ncbi:MAG TPA: GNAT family N-acetyltransferase [Actinotalea sp.]|nr:GNAT family N-acetyltransferase [Actinotalea sp.]
MSVQIRPVQAGDAAAVAEAHVRAWQTAYRGLMPADYLAGLDVAQRADAWRAVIAEGPDGYGVLVAVLDGRVVGFAASGPARDQDAPDLGELYAINLHPDAYARGAAPELLRAVERELARHGHGEAVLWVVPGNARARRFYEREGWAVDDATRPIEIAGRFTVEEMRYRRVLAPVED